MSEFTSVFNFKVINFWVFSSFEERLEISGHNLYIEKIIGGTSMTHAIEICNSRGMELFEPRDSTINNDVWKKARGYYKWSWGYWLNVRGVDPKTK